VFGAIGANAIAAAPFLIRVAHGKSTAPGKAAIAALSKMGPATLPHLIAAGRSRFRRSDPDFARAVAAVVTKTPRLAADVGKAVETENDKHVVLSLIKALQQSGAAGTGAEAYLDKISRAHSNQRIRDAAKSALAAVKR
jgi:hypothetical protein